ncbi:DUF116 domain-containing protein [Bacillota bacterium LX-D]|nr:DUF116 domain-containing protein [Bacillota bacterium LX-D]
MNTRKRLFIGLLLLSLLVIIALIFMGWMLALNSHKLLSYILLVIMGTIVLFFLGGIALGLMILIVNLWRAKTTPSMQNLISAAINFLFPLALSIGRAFKIEEEKIKRSFIIVHNELVLNQKLFFKPADILILAPHCLQWSGCPHKITLDVQNCKRCEKCVIDKLHGVCEKYHVNLVVVTGGTFARKFVKEKRPKAVIAIACERDLTSGIQAVHPLPVIGVLNLRPNGPCFNTTVNISRVEEAVCHLLEQHCLKLPCQKPFEINLPHGNLLVRNVEKG